MNEQNDNERMMLLKDKANYFLNKKTSIHITYFNGNWANGIIREISEDFFLINEFKLLEMPVFFKEVKDIVPYDVGGKKK